MNCAWLTGHAWLPCLPARACLPSTARLQEVIVGLQTDAPLKRAIKPLGGVGVVKSALEAYGFALPADLEQLYTKVRKTHNQGEQALRRQGGGGLVWSSDDRSRCRELLGFKRRRFPHARRAFRML